MTQASKGIIRGIVSPALVCRLLIMICLVARTMQQEQAEQPPPPPLSEEEVWEHGDLAEIHKHLHCSDHRVITNPSTETWKLLQSTYESIVKKEQSSLPPGGFLGVDGFYVTYDIVEYDDEDGGGRGIHTKIPIPNDTLVWKSIRTARFPSAKEYRQFLRQLPPPLSCDVLKWSYTRWEQDTIVACLDLDSGSLIKECNTDDDNDHLNDCTLRVTSPRSSGCHLQFVANRDIQAGEAFRMDYSFSEMDPGWTMFGMWREEDAELGGDDDDDEEEEEEGDDEEDEEEEDEEENEDDDEEEELPHAKEEL